MQAHTESLPLPWLQSSQISCATTERRTGRKRRERWGVVGLCGRSLSVRRVRPFSLFPCLSAFSLFAFPLSLSSPSFPLSLSLFLTFFTPSSLHYTGSCCLLATTPISPRITPAPPKESGPPLATMASIANPSRNQYWCHQARHMTRRNDLLQLSAGEKKGGR